MKSKIALAFENCKKPLGAIATQVSSNRSNFKKGFSKKTTLFTSDKIRHNYLIKLLSKICTNLCVIQETGFDASKANTKKNSFSKIINEYFKTKKEQNKTLLFSEKYFACKA